MADTSVDITPGTGASIDTRTESTNGNHRQVVVLGDPASNAGVAPVDATKGLAVDLSNTGANTTKLLVTPDLPSGASTAANQATGNTSLASIDGKITAVNTGAVVVASSALPSGAATAAKQPAIGTAGTAATDVLTVQGIASMTALKVDGSAVTQPVSGTFWQATQPVSGTVTANAGTNLNTSALALETGGNLASVATNTTNIPNVVGTAASAVPSKLLQVGGSDGTNARAISTTTAGVVKVDLSATAANTTAVKVDGSAVTQPVSNAGTFAVQATLQANSGVDIGKLTANQSVNNAQVNGVAVSTGNGVSGTGVQRVTLASDSTGQVALAAGSATIGALTANQSVNNAQVNGVAVSTGNGVSGTGVQRVTIASDSTGTIAATQSGTWTVQPGNTANSTPWLVTDTAATSGGLSIVTGSVGATATAIKASAGQLYGYHLFNTTAAVAYVQIFNVAVGSVTLGTTAPTFSIGIPASGGVTVNWDKGIAFGTAITFACTTTRAGSTGATVDVCFFYK